MRKIVPILLSLFWTTPVLANDLAQALDFASSVMGDSVTEGFEDFVDYDETEALGLLLSRDVTPGAVPESYSNDRVGFMPKTSFFETLGGQRLDYQSLSRYIQEASDETGLPVALIDAVIRTESGYRPRAVSRSGARGLMQLMPETARMMGVRDPFNPRQNIMGGARYLLKQYQRFRSLKLAIAAYNAGPGAVKRHNGVPPFKETQRYVATVLSRYERSALR